MSDASQPPAARPARWPVVACVLVALVGGVVASYVIRLDYGPDEHDHLAYLHRLAQGEGFYPSNEQTGTLIRMHPPLYYAVLAVIWRAVGVEQSPKAVPPGPLAIEFMTPRSILGRRLTRLANVLLSTATVIILARMLVVLGVPLAWQPVLLLLVAAHPGFQYLSGIVNCQSLEVFWSALVAWQMVALLKSGTCTTRQAIIFGLVVGGGMWAKRTLLYVYPLAVWAILRAAPKGQRVRRLAEMIAAAAAIGIWWPLRAKLQTGDWFPGFMASELHQMAPLKLLAKDPMTILRWPSTLLGTSLFPDWSWTFIPPLVSKVLTHAALLALVVLFVIRWRERPDPVARQLRLLSAAAFGLLLLGVLHFCYTVDWRANFNGRYLLSALPWLLVFLGASLPTATTDRPVRGPSFLVGLGIALLLMLDAGWWVLANDHFLGVQDWDNQLREEHPEYNEGTQSALPAADLSRWADLPAPARPAGVRGRPG